MVDRGEGRPSAHLGSPAVRRVVIALLILDSVADWCGDLGASFLLPGHPLVFVSLNQRIPNLVLASPLLGVTEYYVVGTLRHLAPDPLFFLLGAWYGPRFVAWLESRSALGARACARLQAGFARAPYLLCLFPVSIVCALAGASGMALSTFLVLALIGTLVMMVAVRSATGTVATTIEGFDHWIGAHRLSIVACSLVVALALVWWNRRAGRRSSVLELLDGPPDEASTSTPDRLLVDRPAPARR